MSSWDLVCFFFSTSSRSDKQNFSRFSPLSFFSTSLPSFLLCFSSVSLLFLFLYPLVSFSLYWFLSLHRFFVVIVILLFINYASTKISPKEIFLHLSLSLYLCHNYTLTHGERTRLDWESVVIALESLADYCRQHCYSLSRKAFFVRALFNDTCKWVKIVHSLHLQL